ncbi:hypothetical protein AC579_4867 [Pseudocercospora musae]|uniref:F-box domain-containing protein n=1 Tax=Pseudocercospora musae TaxID=113226 RepID=A0A139IL53_9PEZI|nr:hypothetical protein AC579_4867 [Pseudocercospora musae]
MSTQAVRARSLYRRLLRELPAREPSILANPSPMQKHIRSDFADATHSASLQHQASKPADRRLDEAEQYVQYLASQRVYTTLLERYNPGMNMTEEDRVRLTARRVGMDLPIDLMRGSIGKTGSLSHHSKYLLVSSAMRESRIVSTYTMGTRLPNNTQAPPSLDIQRSMTFVNLPAEIRNAIIALVLPAYSGHIILHPKNESRSKDVSHQTLGPLSLLLVSRRLKSEIHPMLFASYAIHFPPKLHSMSSAANDLFHCITSAIIELGTSPGNGRVLFELGKIELLESLELRCHRPIFGTLELSLHFSSQFKRLRNLKIVDLKKLGRDEKSSSRRPISEDNFVIELSTRIVVFGMAESGMQYDAVELEKDAKKLRDRIEQWTPERNLELTVWPSKKMVQRALWRANECRVEMYLRNESIQECNERSYGTRGLTI